METYKATIKREDERTSLIFEVGTEEFAIVLTEDKPIEVKSVFNKLLIQLKKSNFMFELEDDVQNDLYFFISEEYIKQLNTELSSVYNELEDYELLEEEQE